MDDQSDNKRDGPEEKKPQLPPPGRWSEVMDELYEQAVRDGLFDNLPGHGKPLKLFKNPYAPGTELAYQLLKDNNYTLPWIAERNEVTAAIDALRSEVRRVWLRYQTEYRAARGETIRKSLALGWNGYQERWHEHIAELNRLITNLNLKMPGERLEIMKLTLEGELERAGAGETLA